MRQSYDELFVGGRWVPPSTPATIPVTDPATEQVIAQVPAGTAADAAAAVEAAHAGSEAWAAVPPAERGRYLLRMAEALEPRVDELAALVTADVGTPRALARAVQVELPVRTLAAHAQLAEHFTWEEARGSACVVRAPVGTVAAITPWNFPLVQAVSKIAPALVAGCPVVFKPSEVAPLAAWALAEAAEEADLPPGVLNLVCGTGPEVGEAIVRHPGVDMVSFTGSTAAGKRIASLSAETVKRLALEMGGKSPSIVFEDADLDLAIPASVNGGLMFAGQACVALSRLLVHRSRLAEVEGRVEALVSGMTIGDPRGDVTLGPLVSDAQRRRVRGYIEQGLASGARLVTGGAQPPDGLSCGYYVRPTVFSGVDNATAIAQEEIFGPVLSIIAFDDEDEAVRLANDTIYGLFGAVWSADEARAERVARHLRAGTVQVNGGGPGDGTPFGGFKQSGLGREHGEFGLAEFVELQTLNLPA